MSTNTQVKIIGTNGQLSLGKAFAGKMVLIDQLDNGTWIIKAGEFIPDSEKWLYQNQGAAKLEKALEWAAKTKPTDSFNQFTRSVEGKNVKNQNRHE